MFSALDRKLCQALCDLPRRHKYRYDQTAQNDLLSTLFRSLTLDKADYLTALFPDGFPESHKLQEVQGRDTLAEYTEAARGRPCGHIFQHGEASYHCMTCADDATSVLCARCFDSSDHEGHQFHISPSMGNSGCCDCGDDEAWKRNVNCAIHSVFESGTNAQQPVVLPNELHEAIRTTISRTLDYFCDVISCSPENLRVPKTIETIRHDENYSRLGGRYFSGSDEQEGDPEYCLVLWNDEKHTVAEVEQQISRACRRRRNFGEVKAMEAHMHGRSILRHSTSLEELIREARIIEQIKLTVTIRSSRDTFREQMCGTIIQWLSDIAGCSMLGDHVVLRRAICEQMLHPWKVGSEAYHARVGRAGLDSHGNTEALRHRRRTSQLMAWGEFPGLLAGLPTGVVIEQLQPMIDAALDAQHDAEDTEQDNDDTEEHDDDDDVDDEMIDQNAAEEYFADGPSNTETAQHEDGDGDDVDTDGDAEFVDVREGVDDVEDANMQLSMHLDRADTNTSINSTTATPGGHNGAPVSAEQSQNFQHVPWTPRQDFHHGHCSSASHWTVLPPGYSINRTDVPLYENFQCNVRLDSLILFDLRLWKQARIELRDLYISTVVNIPEFKRVLGLRFSGIYTTLSQLYLVADREPDHSIMNLSLQMLTTPSITKEVIERSNFLTNLLAILYTFLTTRQVGYPKDVDPQATLAFESGSVTNRRLIHFFTDLRWYLASIFVQDRVRHDEQYLLQYLDLAKLAQGICPNTRAVGDHLEFETDAWINASVLTREINKLCRQFAEAFKLADGKSREIEQKLTARAIYNTAYATLVNSLGLERERFEQGEIKAVTRFKDLGPFEFEPGPHRVVEFVVEEQPMSFHHPLHYILSWLSEYTNETFVSRIATYEAAEHLIEQNPGRGIHTSVRTPEDCILAMYDFPIRVCAWLAQMKAGMWVRNGLSLKHQMYQYTGMMHRDVGHHRDLVLIQTALVQCDQSRVLASMIDRFGLESWVRFGPHEQGDEAENLDIVEDFITLLISLLAERDALIPLEQEPEPYLHAIKRSIIHTLCFRPLSYSDLTSRLTERIQDQEQLQDVLKQLTTYKPPEGLHDVGMFELKPEYLSELDPYNPLFNKNQRDEAESIYKKYQSKLTGKPADDIVLEPKLRPIKTGAYTSLPQLVHRPLFAQVIFACLNYISRTKHWVVLLPATRMESFLHIVLQLCLIAALESQGANPDSGTFIEHFMTLGPISDSWDGTSLTALHNVCAMDEFASCRPKIKHLLRHFVRENEARFQDASANLEFPFGRLDTASPANLEMTEAKKRQAQERKSKVLAQFQQQQQSFLDHQGISGWEDEESMEDPVNSAKPESRIWKTLTGVCIHCREETNDSRLYGTFGMFIHSSTLRQTDLKDASIVGEVLRVPESLDRPLEKRPFGRSGDNHERVRRFTTDGTEIEVDRQGLGKGWPSTSTMKSLVSTGCGHIMHFSCFETYYASVSRRQNHQIARNHPERMSQWEFVCPLCKALANVFLPIVYKSVEQGFPGGLQNDTPLEVALYQRNIHEEEITSTYLSQCHYRVHAALENGPWAQTGLHLSKACSGAMWTSEGAIWEFPIEKNARKDLDPLPELEVVMNRISALTKLTQTGVHGDPSSGTLDRAGVFHVLLKVLSDSVSATEIAYRGQRQGNAGSLLDTIPSSILNHLQILTATIELFVVVGTFPPFPSGPGHKVIDEPVQWKILQSVFSRPQPFEGATLRTDRIPFLHEDPFRTLTSASMAICNDERLRFAHLLHICYSAEVLRTILAYFREPETLQAVMDSLDQDQINHSMSEKEFWALRQATQAVEYQYSLQTSYVDTDRYVGSFLTAPMERNRSLGLVLLTLVKAASLAFLRKAAILAHVSHRVDFPALSVEAMDLPEVQRLAMMLQLPSIEQVLIDLNANGTQPSLADLGMDWMQDLLQHEYLSKQQLALSPNGPSPEPGIKLLHPCALELIGLPKYYDILMEESHRRKCPTTGKEVTDPALCLMCGEIFCAQASCCTRGSRGGCNRHVTKCSYPIGIFLIIRKSAIVFLHLAEIQTTTPAAGDSSNPTTTNNTNNQSNTNTNVPPLPAGDKARYLCNGSFFPAPYLTQHGETDSGLRTRHQLILSQHRYDKLLRDVWLMVNPSLTVWSAVARKLEADVNAGGWETL